MQEIRQAIMRSPVSRWPFRRRTCLPERKNHRKKAATATAQSRASMGTRTFSCLTSRRTTLSQEWKVAAVTAAMTGTVAGMVLSFLDILVFSIIIAPRGQAEFLRGESGGVSRGRNDLHTPGSHLPARAFAHQPSQIEFFKQCLAIFFIISGSFDIFVASEGNQLTDQRGHMHIRTSKSVSNLKPLSSCGPNTLGLYGFSVP